ncbi:MAG: 2-hydroxyacid dehydrogenase [Verrucomicrobiales bacterium]|nr:2-hydroxyacid dehydrogenase [Verrucomicrobiales bacterium]
MRVPFYDAKPYDRPFFVKHGEGQGIEYLFHEFRLSAETAASASGCEAICAFVNDTLDHACLERLAASGVRLVALRCAGFNQVDLKAAAALGIRVVRVPAYSPHAVAEHAVALLLTLNRKIHRAYNRVREHNFSLNGLVGFDLHGRTAGLIGTGKIGKLTAQILKGFGMEVLVSDVCPDESWAIEQGVTYTPIEELLRRSDVVSLHTPLTPETHYLINARTLGMMKENAYLVNTSRGGLIDTGALIEALKQRRLGGVALDVYEVEEGVFFEDLSHDVLQDDDLARLLGFPNVLVTSHQGFLTEEALSEIARVTTENLARLVRGEELLAGTEVTPTN